MNLKIEIILLVLRESRKIQNIKKQNSNKLNEDYNFEF